MLRLVATLALLIATYSTASAVTVHIVAFGDSATAGYLVPRASSYPARLQAALRRRGHDVVVENAGISGDTTAGALLRFDSAIAPGTDIAIVEFGTNDLRLRVPKAKMLGNLNKIVRTLRQRGIDVLVIGLGSLDLSDVARANGVPYAQWKLPPHRYRARDDAHFNAEGYAILIARMLPQVETLIARVSRK